MQYVFLSYCRDGGKQHTLQSLDYPKIAATGESFEVAKQEALKLLLKALNDDYGKRKLSFPMQAVISKSDKCLITLPIAAQAKCLLRRRMIMMSLSTKALALKMGVTLDVARNIMNLNRPTRLDTIVDALAAIGYRLTLNLEDTQYDNGPY